MPVILLTGEIEVGKTTICNRVVDLSRRWGHRVSGILSPALLDENDRKVGIGLVDLSSGERRTLAIMSDGAKYEMVVGKYNFNPRVLKWGNEILARFVPQDTLWVVDEIGWLELKRGQGFLAAMSKLANPPSHTLILVRRDLVSPLRRHITSAYTTAFFATPENRNNLASLVARRIWGKAGR